MKLAFISVFDDTPKGRRAQRLADALDNHYDVTRYGHGSDATPLSDYAGFEPILFYYVYDNPLFEKILAYSKQRVGYVFVDDIDLITAKYPSFISNNPSFTEASDQRGIPEETKKQLLQHGMSAYPPGTGFYQIETDEHGDTYRWTKRTFSLLLDADVDEIRIEAYTEIPCLVYSNGEVKALYPDTKHVLSFPADGHTTEINVVKPRLQYLLLGEWRRLGIRVYKISFLCDGEHVQTFTPNPSKTPPWRQLADIKPVLPERGYIISPYQTVTDNVDEVYHLPYGYPAVDDESDDVLALTDKATRDEIEYLLEHLDYDDRIVFLRSAYCDIETIVANAGLETEITVVQDYDKRPWRIIYPYSDDKSYPLLSRYTPCKVMFLDDLDASQHTINKPRLRDAPAFNPEQPSAATVANQLTDILV
jgi:hypothetical protein